MPKEETKNKILEALAKLITTKGFQNVGVNAIAREAGVDKVLIYRYFDNLPNLLKVFARQEEIWPGTEHLMGMDSAEIPDKDATDLLIRLFTNHLKELIKRPTTQSIMCWELIENNELTDALTKKREAQGLELLGLAPEELRDVPGVDVPAALILIHAGISYLVLRSRTAQQYAGVDLTSKEGWQRVEQGIMSLVTAFTKYCQAGKAITNRSDAERTTNATNFR